MAEFAQPPATREALHDAAQKLVADRAGLPALLQHIIGSSTAQIARQADVSQRTAQRWQSFLTGKGSQQRKPSTRSLQKLAQATPGPLRMRLDATLVIGGDPAYSRRRTGIIVDFSDEEAAEMVSEALADDEENKDDAWQTFFDVYACPAGWVEQPNIHLSMR